MMSIGRRRMSRMQTEDVKKDKMKEEDVKKGGRNVKKQSLNPMKDRSQLAGSETASASISQYFGLDSLCKTPSHYHKSFPQ